MLAILAPIVVFGLVIFVHELGHFLAAKAAGVSLPATLSLPDASGLQNPSDPASPIYIGDKPVVTGTPRVVDGDVKY